MPGWTCSGDCIPIVGWMFMGLALATFGYNTWLVMHSHPYRNDLRPGESVRSGSAALWQLNVLNRANYKPGRGKQVHTRIIASLLCSTVSWIVAWAFFAWSEGTLGG